MKLDLKIIINAHPMVYEPSEDSRLLLSHVEVKKNENVLEIGTGYGLIALHCAKKLAKRKLFIEVASVYQLNL